MTLFSRHTELVLVSKERRSKLIIPALNKTPKQFQSNNFLTCHTIHAFTLVEIMIVLMVIGILTAILLPSARNAMPNEDILKFKKAHNALHTTIRELVNSDKYYLDGDLGVKPDGTLVTSSTYLCETMSDILNVKDVQCLRRNKITR